MELMHRCTKIFFVPAKSREEGVAWPTPTDRDDAGAKKNQCIKALKTEISIKGCLCNNKFENGLMTFVCLCRLPAGVFPDDDRFPFFILQSLSV